MRLIPLALTFAASAVLTACDDSSTADEQKQPGSSKPYLQIPIDPEWQQLQLAACKARMQYYQDQGVWKHGGVAPGVALDAWEELSEQAKAEIFQIAACIASSGEMLEQTITVSVEGNGRAIETRKVISDQDFVTVGK